MKILLTGATGFIGKELYSSLRLNNEVFVLGKTPIKNCGHEHFIQCDFRNNLDSYFFDKLPKVDIVVHAAQSRQYKAFPESAEEISRVNIGSTIALLNYVAKAHVKQFIFFSSGSVYEPFEQPCIEANALKPESYYPANKYASELLSLCYKTMMKVCIFRLFFAYGPGQTDRLIPELIQRVIDERPICLSGKNGLELGVTYIDDIVKIANRAILDQWEGIINIASPEFVTIKTIGDTIARLLNCDVKFEDNYLNSKARIVPNLNKLKTLYSPFKFTPLEVGLQKMLQAYKQKYANKIEVVA